MVYNTAASYGATVDIDYNLAAHPIVFNDKEATETALEGAKKIFNDENLVSIPKIMLGEDFSMYQKNIPTLKPAYCGAMKRIFCCIGPDLLLYRCEHYIGRKEYAIGNVRDGYNEENELDKKFLSDLPIKCRSCKFLIICQGGCQANRLLDNIEPECEYMERSVRWQIENLLKGNKKESECYGIDFSNIEC